MFSQHPNATSSSASPSPSSQKNVWSRGEFTISLLFVPFPLFLFFFLFFFFLFFFFLFFPLVMSLLVVYSILAYFSFLFALGAYF